VELSANDWLGLGEAWSVRGLTTFEGLTAQTLGVSAPLGGSGLRAGLGYTNLLYKIGRDFAPLDASGEGQSASALSPIPFIRGRQANLTGQLTLEQKNYIDRDQPGRRWTSKNRARPWPLRHLRRLARWFDRQPRR
jgi:hemolysin activation/secretion protein